MSIIISIALFLAGLAFGIKWEEDKNMASVTKQPIKTWTLWLSIALIITSFLVFYLGSK